MKVYLLFTGEYEQRIVHSVHSTESGAKAVDSRVRRDWPDKNDEADIDCHELDPSLCLVCGYDEEPHTRHPASFKHAFQPAAPSQSATPSEASPKRKP